MSSCKDLQWTVVHARPRCKARRAIDMLCATVVAIGLWLVITPSQAWAGGGSMENHHAAASAGYWTAERLRNAVLMPLPRPTKTLPRTAEESLPKGSPVGEEGQGPTVRVLPDEAVRLF